MSYDPYAYDVDEMTGAEFAAALQGEYGEDIQAQVMAVAGLEYEDDGQQQQQGFVPEDVLNARSADFANEFVIQQGRLEQRMGRPLTSKEIETLAQDTAGSINPPDLEKSYKEVIGRDTSDDDDRRAVMAETFEDVQQEQNAFEAYQRGEVQDGGENA